MLSSLGKSNGLNIRSSCGARPNVRPSRSFDLICSRAWEDGTSTSGSAPLPSRLVPQLASCVLAGLLVLQPITGSAIAETVQHTPTHTVRLEDMKNPLLQEGVRAATNKDFVKAEAIFSAMLQQDGVSDTKLGASLWSNLGNVHLSLGKPEIAVEDYTRAIELAPEAPVPYMNRAIALEELGVKLERTQKPGEASNKWELAIADCDAAIARDPNEFAAFFNKGNVMMRMNDYSEARECFARAADLAPGIAGYRLRTAQLMFQDGDVATALQTARGVARKYANYSEAHLTLAALLWSEGQVSDAEGEFNTATELEPRWRDMAFVRRNVRWPPALLTAMEKLVTLELPAAQAKQA